MADKGSVEDYPATAGRQAFLRDTGLRVPDPPWLQTGSGGLSQFKRARGDGTVPPGYDFMATQRAEQWIHVPASKLGKGMEEFKQMVEFAGTPLSAKTGNADTVMERLGEAEPERAVPTRLVAFANVSTEPIELRGKGALAGRYWLYVTLSPTHESTGETVLFAEDGERSGTFLSRINFAPLFELRPVDGGDSVFVDTGQMSLPGFPMELGVSKGRWALDAPREAMTYDSGQSLFYPETVTLRTEPSGMRAPGDPVVLAACEKVGALR